MNIIINPIDLYNQQHVDDGLNLFLKKNQIIKKINKSDYGCQVNKDDELVIQFHQNSIYLEVVAENQLGIPVGTKLSPFEILKEYQFKGKFMPAVEHVVSMYGGDEDLPYIRVGGDFFKRIYSFDRNGVEREELQRWKRETIIDDHGRDVIESISKYDGFCIVPDNKNYQRVVKGMYNKYAPFPHKSKEFDLEKKDEVIKWSLHMIRHIFGDQRCKQKGPNNGRHMGEMYMQMLYLHPRQILPILALVSQLRQTGKSTYGDWLNAIFGDNVANINPHNISSSFSSAYATKNICLIEETKFDKSQDLEKIKSLSTQKTLTVNTKYVSEYQVPFFGKLIMFSNHEDRFVQVDNDEIRYWVRKIPQISVENHNILQDLIDEIPYFLYYLEQLPEVDFSKSRMVFTAEDLETDLLRKTKEESKPALQKIIEEHLDEFGMNNTERDEICFTPIEFHKHFLERTKYDVAYTRKIFKHEMSLEQGHGRYRGLSNDYDTKDRNGRWFMWKNPHYENSVVDDDDLPF